MQSTKKAPPRREDGPSIASEEAAVTISLTATQTAALQVRGGWDLLCTG